MQHPVQCLQTKKRTTLLSRLLFLIYISSISLIDSNLEPFSRIIILIAHKALKQLLVQFLFGCTLGEQGVDLVTSWVAAIAFKRKKERKSENHGTLISRA